LFLSQIAVFKKHGTHNSVVWSRRLLEAATHDPSRRPVASVLGDGPPRQVPFSRADLTAVTRVVCC